jgi:hypothetical protein
MPRKPPPPHPRGAPRTPGSGRKKGTPNRKTVEMRALMAALVNDVDYQHRVREDFSRRRVHPSTESPIWAYAIGKPTEKIEMSARLSMDETLAAERELLRRLPLHELEALAVESQTLVDKALAMAKGKHAKPAVPIADRRVPDGESAKESPDKPADPSSD